MSGRRYATRLHALALLACLAATSARAQDAGATASEPPAGSDGLPAALRPTLKSSLAPNTIQVGDVAKLTLEVSAPATVQVSLPEQPFGGLELADRRMRTEPDGDRVRTIYELDLLAFEPGSVEIAPITVRFVGPNGELGEEKSGAHALTVRSLLANEPNAEPKPATKPVSVVRDDYTLAWVGLGLLGAALVSLATLYGARWWKSRPKALPPPPPPRPPWELAFERLQALARDKQRMLAEKRGEEFVDGVSDAVREYLGRRYGFDGLERTTAELLSTLEAVRTDRVSLSAVSLLLEQCDLVKFARATPSPEQCDGLFDDALKLVRSTIPNAPPPTTPAPAPTQKELGA